MNIKLLQRDFEEALKEGTFIKLRIPSGNSDFETTLIPVSSISFIRVVPDKAEIYLNSGTRIEVTLLNREDLDYVV